MLQEIEPQPTAILLIVQLVEEHHVYRQDAARIVRFHARGQRIQVGIDDEAQRLRIRLTELVASTKIVNPQHVVVAGRVDRFDDLILELLVDHVPHVIAVRERAADCSLDQRVELLLSVVLLRQ